MEPHTIWIIFVEQNVRQSVSVFNLTLIFGCLFYTRGLTAFQVHRMGAAKNTEGHTSVFSFLGFGSKQ